MAPAQSVVERPEEAREEEKRKRMVDAICVSAGMMALSIGTCVPARAPLVLAIKGDPSSTATTMGLMSTAAAGAELLMNPVIGKLSDQYGRKPFMTMAAVVTAILHAGVAAMPRNLAWNFLDRVISGALIFGFMTPMSAALQDIHLSKPPKPAELQAIGAAAAKLGSYFGAGFAAGPLLGSQLGAQGAFAASTALFAATAAYIQKNFDESLPESERKPFDIAAVTPFSFIKLFQTKAMTTLSVSLGLSSFAEYANIYDINFLFMKTVMNWGQQQVGSFAAAFGVTQTIGGQMSKQLIQSIGQEGYTKLAFAAYILGFGALGSAKTVQQFVLSLFFFTFGHQRNTEVGNLLAVQAIGRGMGKGEVTAAGSNLVAVLKLIAPLLYARVFAFNTSGGRKRPGSPYFLICVFLMLSQLVFSTYDKKSTSSEKN